MFIQRIIQTAAIGKGLELRAVVEERVREVQGEGQRAGLARILVGDGYRLVTTIVHDSLAAFQARIEAAQQDRVQAYLARVSPLLGERTRSALYEVLIEPPEAASTAKFSQRFALTPAVGKALEMQQVLTDRFQSGQGPAFVGALVGMAAGGPAEFAVTVFLNNLGEADALLAASRADPTWPGFVARVAAVSGANPVIDINQVLVPVQPAAIREMAGAATR